MNDLFHIMIKSEKGITTPYEKTLSDNQSKGHTLPGNNDFRALINQKLQTAKEHNKPFVELNVGDLHREAGAALVMMFVWQLALTL